MDPKLSGSRFEIRLHPGAAREYNDLDPQVARVIDRQFERLSERADQVGTHSKLPTSACAGPRSPAERNDLWFPAASVRVPSLRLSRSS